MKYENMTDKRLRETEDVLWSKINTLDDVEFFLRECQSSADIAHEYSMQYDDFDLDLTVDVTAKIHEVVQLRKELKREHNEVDEKLHERES